jgi:hypothetical protein
LLPESDKVMDDNIGHPEELINEMCVEDQKKLMLVLMLMIRRKIKRNMDVQGTCVLSNVCNSDDDDDDDDE